MHALAHASARLRPQDRPSRRCACPRLRHRGRARGHRGDPADRQLITKDGTGNFNGLFAAGYHTPAGPQRTPSPDVDAWYLHGRTPRDAAPLVRMAKDIYLGWYY